MQPQPASLEPAPTNTPSRGAASAPAQATPDPVALPSSGPGEHRPTGDVQSGPEDQTQGPLTAAPTGDTAARAIEPSPVPIESSRIGSPVSPQTITMTQGVAGAVMVVGALLVAWAVRRRVLARKDAAPVAESAPLAEADLAGDMQALADRLAADLEARAERLEALIAAADDRLRRLDAAGRAAPAALAEPKPAPKAQGRTLEAAHRDVYELADSGFSIIDIARKLERPTGQIELILNLRRSNAAW